MQNPPDFPISNKCCEYAKKKPAKRIVKEHDADLDITGIRQAEGGIRSAAFKTCFSECKSKGCNTFRPVFWYTAVSYTHLDVYKRQSVRHLHNQKKTSQRRLLNRLI